MHALLGSGQGPSSAAWPAGDSLGPLVPVRLFLAASRSFLASVPKLEQRVEEEYIYIYIFFFVCL